MKGYFKEAFWFLPRSEAQSHVEFYAAAEARNSAEIFSNFSFLPSKNIFKKGQFMMINDFNVVSKYRKSQIQNWEVNYLLCEPDVPLSEEANIYWYFIVDYVEHF